MTEPRAVFCEKHEGTPCYRGGNAGSIWTCVACRIEELERKLASLGRALASRTDHLA